MNREKTKDNTDIGKLIASYYPNNEIRLKYFGAGYSPKSHTKPEQRLSYYDKIDTVININCESGNPFKKNKDKSHKDKPGYGVLPTPRKFGLNARRTILRVGGVADKLYGKNAVFLTGTLPGSTPEAMEAIAKYSGYIVNRCLQFIRRNSDNYLNAYMYVWERQKRGALHLHLVVFSNDKNVRLWFEYQWWFIWRKIINDVCDKSGIDLWKKTDNYSHKDNQEVLQADSCQIEKNVAAYLSKYLGKNDTKDNSNNNKYYPSRWWGCSQYLKDKLKEYTRVISAVISHPKENIVTLLNEAKKLITKTYNYCHKYLTGATTVIYSVNNSDKIWELINNTFNNQSPMNARLRYQRILESEQIKEEREIAALEVAYGKNRSKYQRQKERHQWHLYTKEYSEILNIYNGIDSIDSAWEALPRVEKFYQDWYNFDGDCPLPKMIYDELTDAITNYYQSD